MKALEGTAFVAAGAARRAFPQRGRRHPDGRFVWLRLIVSREDGSEKGEDGRTSGLTDDKGTSTDAGRGMGGSGREDGETKRLSVASVRRCSRPGARSAFAKDL